mgnify:CR=1 FL=1
MDPLADKLLVCAAMICLIELGRIPAWIVIVINLTVEQVCETCDDKNRKRDRIRIVRDLVAADNRVVIAANYWGKFKTTFQMIMVCLMIINIEALAVLSKSL